MPLGMTVVKAVCRAKRAAAACAMAGRLAAAGGVSSALMWLPYCPTQGLRS